MADYWKSQAKKFCDFCKCWIADNKPSIEFHEKGKRHQENVKQRISDIRKKSTKDFKAKEKLDDDMRKMEEAALRAYQKDIAVNPDYSSTSFEMPTLPAERPKPMPPAARPGPKQPYKKRKPFRSGPAIIKGDEREDSSEIAVPSPVIKQESSTDEPLSTSALQESSTNVTDQKKEIKPEKEESRLWYESVSDQGYSYYWNTQTNESVWEPPEEGYVSLAEQQAQLLESGSTEDNKKEKQKQSDEVNKKVKQESKSDDSSDTLSSSSEDDEVEQPPGSKEEEEKEVAAAQPSTISDDIPVTKPAMGPMPRANPYGSWQTIVKVETPKIDLQLPEKQTIELQVPTLSREPRMTFKEKTVTSLANVNEIGSFKKRKLASGHKRNMRQRVDDDD